MTKSVIVVALSAAAAIIMLTDSAAAQVVDLGYARYQGFVDPNTHNTHFLGMRYAAAPTGPLRWRAPQTPQLTTGIQQANAQPAMCFSAGQGNAGTSPFRVSPRAAAVSQSEDCLFLNVYTPGNLTQAAKNLPVVVWIHGGGYMAGSASGFSGTDIFNGDDLIREANGGVVAVIIQYRLGVFGFLPGAKVKQGGDLNAGLLDQDFAFRWVQKHIHQFNGDPRRVTIWGESAGAGSVLQHVIANDGNTQPPLFRAAISSSSYLPSQYRYDNVVPEKLYSDVVSQTNCASATDSLSCLRAVDAGTLEGANVNIGTSVFFGTFVFVPVVDGTFIRQGATEAFKQRKVNGEAIMAVTNTFEGALFVNSSTTATVQTPNYVAQLFPLLEGRQIADATAQYKDIGAPIDQAVAIMGESIFICPTYSLLRAFGAKAFKGEFAIPPGGHGNDVVYYFPNGGSPPFANPDFDKAFSESFLNFAMSLNPGIKSDPTTITPKWNAWEGSTEMLFNKTEAGAPDIRPIKTSSALLERCSFWESVAATTGQ